MRPALAVLLFLPVPQAVPTAPTGLIAVSATRPVVSLAWTAADPAVARYALERKPLGASWTPPPEPKPSPIVTTMIDGTEAKDTAIDAFATYVYHVHAIGADNAQSAPSNEITVGPPPLGFSQVQIAPSTLRDPGQFARGSSVALDRQRRSCGRVSDR